MQIKCRDASTKLDREIGRHLALGIGHFQEQKGFVQIPRSFPGVGVGGRRSFKTACLLYISLPEQEKSDRVTDEKTTFPLLSWDMSSQPAML